MDGLALLASVAATLPRIQRPGQTLAPRRLPRRWQPPEAVLQQRPGDVGEMGG